MTKFEEKLAEYKEQLEGMDVKVDQDALKGVTKACGPSIYNADASKVSSSDPKELERVRTNFIVKKLGQEDEKKGNDAIQEVVDMFGSSNRNKNRAVFYYLLAKKFRKLSSFK